jgi:DNA phosphorothioation-dependent restriction protein DptH
MRVGADETLGHLENAGQLRDIFAAIFPELGDLQREAIRSALKETYESEGWGTSKKRKTPAVPGFREFLTRLQQAPRPDTSRRALLARLGELDDYGFFKTTTENPSLLLAQQPVVLQIHRTNNEAVQRAYASFAFYRIYQDMFARGRKDRLTHAVIFDEAHKASRLKLIPTMAKECRKFGLSLILASQEAKDFDTALFTAIANYLTLRVTEDTARHLSKMTVAHDRQRGVSDRLKQLPKYHALWLCEGRKSPIQIALRASP